MTDGSQERGVPLLALFGAGAAMDLLAAIALFTRQPTTGVVVLALGGIAAMIGAVFVSRSDEGRVEAGRRGVTLEWRREIVKRVADGLSEVGAASTSTSDLPTEPPLHVGPSMRAHTRIELWDINNDGEEELVVQHQTGAHSSELQAFGWMAPSPRPPSRRSLRSCPATPTDSSSVI